jgi:uncharacterized membrane protein YhfC
MVESSVVTSFVIALVFTTVVPIAILIVLGATKRLSGVPLLLGILSFFISQIVVRIPLLTVFSEQGWFQSFATQFIPYVLVLSFTAGLFEESARLGGALLLKKRRSYRDVISFGLGHGFCEVVLLIGLTHINNVLGCVAVNNPGGAIAAIFPPDVFQIFADLLPGVDAAHVYLGILERVFAVVVHIFATVLVFQGVIRRNWWYYILAIVAHTLVNLVAILLANYVNIYASEAALFVIAAVMGVYVIKSKKGFAEDINL